MMRARPGASARLRRGWHEAMTAVDTPTNRHIATVVVWCLAAASLVPLLLSHFQHLPHGRHGWNDSYVYLGAATDFIAHPSHLYDNATIQLTRSFATRAFLYPPSGLLPFLPLVPVVHAIGLHGASIVWSCVDTVALLSALVLVARRLGCSWLVIGAVIALVSRTPPVGWEIASGQVNGVVLLLIVLAVRRYPGRISGVLMALALCVKPVAGIVLLVPVLRRRPGVSAVAIAVIVALNLPFVPLIGLGTAAHYVGAILPFMLGYVIHDSYNGSLPNMLQLWLGGGHVVRRQSVSSGDLPHAVDALITLWLARLAVLAAWLRVTLDGRVDATLAFALALATVPIFSATVWPHYFLFTLPLVLTLVADRPAWVRAGGVAAVVLMMVPNGAIGLWLSMLVLWAVTLVRLFSGRIAPMLSLPRRPGATVSA